MKRGFTLIELLLIVAMLTVLAAIAVPNYLERQARRQAGRVKSDLRAYAMACEAYNLDYRSYPITARYPMLPQSAMSFGAPYRLCPLSTPVAYMADVWLADPFRSSYRYFAKRGSAGGVDWEKAFAPPNDRLYLNFYFAQTHAPSDTSLPDLTYGDMFGSVQKLASRQVGLVSSYGPGADTASTGYVEYAIRYAYPSSGLPKFQQAYDQFYDPTNGALSGGAIARFYGDVGNRLPLE